MRSEPVFNVPLVVLAVIATLAAVHGGREFLSVEAESRLILDLAFVPARLAAALGADPRGIVEAAGRAADAADVFGPAERVTLARFVLAGGAKPWTLATYAFLHGGVPHLVLNGVWLLAFGSAIARRFGAARFLVFFVLTAAGGALGHALARGPDIFPLVGASAAVSGCMAAAVRFMFQPGAPLGTDRGPADPGYRLPAQPFGEALRDGRVLGFLAIWFVTNLLTGLGAAPLGVADASIAWEAHVAGFLVGLVAFRAFDPSPAALRRGAP